MAEAGELGRRIADLRISEERCGSEVELAVPRPTDEGFPLGPGEGERGDVGVLTVPQENLPRAGEQVRGHLDTGVAVTAAAALEPFGSDVLHHCEVLPGSW